MNRLLLGCAGLALVISSMEARAAATVDDAFASFNGTQGAGNFYYGKFGGGVFTSFTPCGAIDFPTTSCLGSASYPYFARAASPGPHFGATLPMDRLLTHTTLGAGALITWIAPVAGEYRIDGVFSLHHQDRHLGNGIGVVGSYLPFGEAVQTVPRFVLNQAEATVSLVRSFAAGDRYTFSLDANGNNGYDLGGINVVATRLSEAAVVPEPGTWAMLIAGFGLVAVWQGDTASRNGLPDVAV